MQCKGKPLPVKGWRKGRGKIGQHEEARLNEMNEGALGLAVKPTTCSITEIAIDQSINHVTTNMADPCIHPSS